jgi:predicted PhzF superfamily epimerase YddE/YHI9
VENLKPQFHKMLDFHGRGSIFATALASEHSEHDVISRVFCPKMGIPEDSATGSAHCTIGQYWATKLGKNELKAFQASERGGKMLVRVDKDVGRVYLQAQAVVVMAGALPTAKG